MAKKKQFAEQPSPDILTGEVVSQDMLTRAGWRSSNAIPTIANPSAAWQIMMHQHGARAVELYYANFEEKHTHYGAQLETRREALLSRNTSVISVSENPEDEKIRDAVKGMLKAIRQFHTVREGGLDALNEGVAMAELMWGYKDGLLMPLQIKWRPQFLFSFGGMVEAQDGELRLCPDGTGDGTPVSALNAGERFKFIVVTYKPKKGNRWGSPLGRRVFWPIWFELQGARTWLKFMEKGTGTVVTRYPTGSDIKKKDQALEAAQTINEDVACAVADGMNVEILEKARSGATDVYMNWVKEYCQAMISRRVLGQLGTSEGIAHGGGRAAVETLKIVQQEKMKSDANMEEDWVNDQLIATFILVNFGPNIPAPRYQVEVEEKADLAAASVVKARLQQMGLPISAVATRKQFDEPEPIKPEDVLVPIPGTHPAGGTGGATGADNPVPAEFSTPAAAVPGRTEEHASETGTVIASLENKQVIPLYQEFVKAIESEIND
jgi:phage gp29-like protein